MFRPRNFYLIMHGMGVTSTFYEEQDIDVSEETRREVDDRYRAIADEVRSYHTTEEFYRGILGV